MKIKQTFILLLLLCATAPLSSFKNKAGDKGVYGFVYVSGTFTESHHTLISQIFYEPPYPECKDNSFWPHAQLAFAKYLNAYNDDEKFNRGDVQSHHSNYSRSYLTQKEAQDAMEDTIIKEKGDGYEIKMISYTYSCQ